MALVSKDNTPTRKGEAFVKGIRLQAFREVRGHSQAGLAAIATSILRRQSGDPKAGLSESLVALIETDRRQPSIRTAELLAEALDIPLGALADIATCADEDHDWVGTRRRYCSRCTLKEQGSTKAGADAA